MKLITQCSRVLACTAFVLLGLSGGQSAEARDMHGRLGLGYNAQFANTEAVNGTPALSLKYGLTRDIAAALVVGTNTTDPSNSVVALKLFKNIFFETNLNFYFVIAGGIVTASSTTGADFLTAFGSEFFIPGIESLGFSVEMGARMDNLNGSFSIRTTGLSFLTAGIHFYF